MLKKVLLGALALAIIASAGLFIWARSILTQDNVRTTVAERLTQSLGQPVSIGGIGAAIYPRVSLNLDNVTIGSGIRVDTLAIGTDFRALLSRRIEHGSMRLTGAHVQLPLPDFQTSAAPEPRAGTAPGRSPVEIVSIDEVVLSGVEIVSGGRTLRGDIDVVPQGNGLTVKRIALSADNMNATITGQLTDLAGPTGELTVKAGALDVSQLLAFVADFSKGAGMHSSGGSKSSAMNVAIAMDADRATMGTLSLERLSGQALVTSAGMALEPITFGVFGGRYAGSLTLTLGDTPDFHLKAALSGIDMATAMKAAGNPGTITGRLSGTIDVTGRGLDAASVEKSARGTLQVDIADGVVKNLGLIQAVVVATSMRSGAFSQKTGSRDEAFTHLGGTLAIANGAATTSNLRFESTDMSVGAAGHVRLDGSAVDLRGQAQLSEALSQQAGRDLLRYSQENGRVTLPATIGGSAANLQVRIDVAEAAKRAVSNRAKEEAQKQITKGLGKLLGGSR